MAKECRKYGISLVLASQEAKDFNASLFSNISNYVVLRLTEADVKALPRRSHRATSPEQESRPEILRTQSNQRWLFLALAKVQRPEPLHLLDLIDQRPLLIRALGLTRTYNLFHNPECTDADIARLRDLHAAMDRATLACYGWAELDPGHGFHQNERGQTRCTISPTARRELLRRLLALNHDIAAQQVFAGNTS